MDCAVIAQPYNHVSNIRRKNIWYSIGSGNWTNPNIWMSNALTPSTNIANQYPGQGSATYVYPRVGDDVYIGFGHTVTGSTNLSLNNLYVAGILQFDGAPRTFTVNGDLQATGTVDLSTAAHNIVLNGINNYVVTFIRGTSSTVIYNRLGDQPILAGITHQNITVQGTGKKYIAENTFINGNLVVTGNSTAPTVRTSYMELSVYDLTVNGNSNLTGVLSKTGTGNVTFNGNLVLGNGFVTIDFSIGNPTVEVKAGIQVFNQTTQNGNFKSGTGTWTFSTNNQAVTFDSAGVSNLEFKSPIVVTNGITLTFDSTTTSTSNQTVYISNSLTGSIASSKVVNKINMYFTTTSLPMPVGIFDWTTYTTSMIGYVFNGNYTIPYNTYQGLYISGTGTKSLGANTTVSQQTTLISSGTLDAATFDITTNVVNISGGASLAKSGAGNMTFNSYIFINSGSGTSLNFTGNPNCEFKGGISYYAGIINSGAGTWTFSTNNQSIDRAVAGTNTWTFNAQIIISGAITLTLSASGAGSPIYIFTNIINGNNAASTLDSRVANGSVQYQNIQQPMLTGVLQTNAAANTFIYNKAGDQNIAGGTYRTLTLAGSGVKTLQGNVVVATAYTLTPPATLNTNGFTRT